MASRPSNRKEPVKGRVGSANTATTPPNRRPPSNTVSAQKVSRGNPAQEHRKQQAARKQSSPSQYNSGQSARGPSSQIQDHGSPSKKARGGSAIRQPERPSPQPHHSPPHMLHMRERLPENRINSGDKHRNLPPKEQWLEQELKKREDQIRDLQQKLWTSEQDSQDLRDHCEEEKKRHEHERTQMQRQIVVLQRELKNIQQDPRNLRDRQEVERTRLANDTMSERRKLQDQIEEEKKGYEQERAQMQMQIHDLQRKLENIQQDPRNSRDRLEEEKKRHEQERAQMQRQIADLQRKLESSQQELRNLRDRHEVERTQLAKSTMTENRRLQEQIEELKRENNNLKSKNQDLLTRISSMASERMRSNNPCVEDLSDPNRHSAVLAKWQALMNGEYWTLYEVALKKLPDEKNTAQFLLRIMELGFKEAQYMQNGSKAFLDLMQTQRQAQGDPSMAALLDLLMKNENFQQIVDSESRKVRKGGNATLPASAFQDFRKKIQKDMRNTASDLLEKSHKFADEVLRLCFLMALQSPPMALVFDRPEDKEMDALLYEPDGDRNRPRPCIVNFVLTPPLLRYEGGPVLNKGTVELR